jgi:hypothetical protein
VFHHDDPAHKIFQEERKITDMSIKYLNEMNTEVLAKNQELVVSKYNTRRI